MLQKRFWLRRREAIHQPTSLFFAYNLSRTLLIPLTGTHTPSHRFRFVQLIFLDSSCGLNKPVCLREWHFCHSHSRSHHSSSSPHAAGFGAGPTDPFSSSGGKAAFGHAKIHIRIQQRNGRKCITTIQGLENDLDLKRICKAMKRAFNCNGSIAEDEEMGEIVQLQGDQRQNVKEWLVEQEIVNRTDADDRLVIHGF